MTVVERLAVVVLASIALPVAAAFGPGDLAISSGVIGNSPPAFAGLGEVRSAGGRTTVLGHPEFPLYVPSAVGFHPSGVLLMSRQFAMSGPVATDVYASPPLPSSSFAFGGNAFAFDAEGTIYVDEPATSGPGGTRIVQYALNGALSRTSRLIPDRIVRSLDLAADQCTIFYGYDAPDGTGRVGRYDVCSDTPLADVPIVLGPYATTSGLRVLPDHSLLVTAGDRALRISTSGAILQTYVVPDSSGPWRAIALDPTGASFWVGVGRDVVEPKESLFRINVATGAVVEGRILMATPGPIRSLAVFDEWRAALATPIPALPYLAMTVVGFALAVLAARRLGC